MILHMKAKIAASQGNYIFYHFLFQKMLPLEIQISIYVLHNDIPFSIFFAT